VQGQQATTKKLSTLQTIMHHTNILTIYRHNQEEFYSWATNGYLQMTISKIEQATIKHCMKKHRLIADHHSLNKLLHHLQTDMVAGLYPKSARDVIHTLQTAMWSSETSNGSQLIAPALRKFFNVDICEQR